MTSLSYRAVVEALDADEPDPLKIFAAAEGLAGAFVRHEHVVGLLPINAPRLMVRAYEVAGEAGNADAAFELSVMHFGGIGVPADDDLGMHWTHRAAQMGQPRAMGNLGVYYATAQYGLPLDPAIAVDWYEKSAEGGIGHSALIGGVMLLRGDDGLAVDRERAAYLFHLADYHYDDVDDKLEATGLSRPR